MANPAEIPQHILTPDYWDGHSFDDNCEWTEPKVRPDEGLLTSMGRDSKAEGVAADILRDFMRMSSRVKLRNLEKGQLFNSKDYPLGTIIRYSEETLRQSTDPKYTDFNYWGVTVTRETDIGSKIVLIRFSEFMVSQGRYNWAFNRWRMPIEVGQVEHFRLNTQDGEKLQDLRRVNDLEIWKMGQGMPERKTQSSILGRLIPKFNQG